MLSGCSTVPVVGPATVRTNDATVSELVLRHNVERQEPLTLHELLTQAAQSHASWMAANKRMSHSGGSRSTPGERIKAAGYDWTTYGENVAYGQQTPDAVMQVWMASRGHKRNIQSTAYHDIGIGYARSSTGTIYWCVTFGNQAFAGDDWSLDMAEPEFEENL